MELLLARDLLMGRGEQARTGVGATALLAAINDSLKSFDGNTDSREFHSAVMRAMPKRLLPEARRVAPPLSWTG